MKMLSASAASEKNHKILRNVFFSWQSWKKNNHEYFSIHIQHALGKLNEQSDQFDYQYQEATRNQPGSPDIASTIFQKIDLCHVFIADVSIVGTENNRSFPNPNVLTELGYAARAIGWDRILLMFDQTTEPEKLPFDIRQHRMKKCTVPKPNAPDVIKRTRKYIENICSQEIKDNLEIKDKWNEIETMIRAQAPHHPIIDVDFVDELCTFIGSMEKSTAYRIPSQEDMNRFVNTVCGVFQTAGRELTHLVHELQSTREQKNLHTQLIEQVDEIIVIAEQYMELSNSSEIDSFKNKENFKSCEEAKEWYRMLGQELTAAFHLFLLRCIRKDPKEVFAIDSSFQKVGTKTFVYFIGSELDRWRGSNMYCQSTLSNDDGSPLIIDSEEHNGNIVYEPKDFQDFLKILVRWIRMRLDLLN